GGLGGGGGGGGGSGGLPPTGATLIDVQLGIIDGVLPLLPVDPAPNTVVDVSGLGVLGVNLVLNEQTREGDGVHSLSLGSNALHLTLDIAGLISGDVVLASSAVSLT